MATSEHTINDALAGVLAETRSLWRVKGVVRAENIQILKGNAKHPDILVAESNVSPVVLETEVLPAVTVEADAYQRLGQKVLQSGRPILSSVAVRMPAILRYYSGQDLKDKVTTAEYEMALYSGKNPSNYLRWPKVGWLKGNIADLSVLIQSASIPHAVIEKAADRLVSGVSEAAALLNEVAHEHPAAIQAICQQLRQQEDEQTLRMAMTIVANALVFHESLAKGPGDLANVHSLDELRTQPGGLTKSSLIQEWQLILKVNYWPIFDIARRIVELIPADNVGLLMETLVSTASELTENRLMRSHDLTGVVFQRLIADRKFLAAFYTHPASAALLVGLALVPEKTPADGAWSDVKAVASLHVADFACGTGTLLSTAYRRISQLHEIAGGDAEKIHADMMAHAFVGCDVLPAAAHLTASMLASAHPTVTYKGSGILTVDYGPRAGGGVALGSLDLLDPQRAFSIVAVTAKAMEAMGESECEVWETLPHESFDLVLMNPPFTRDTSHEGKNIGISNPMFAAFGAPANVQKEMAKTTERLLKNTSAHGNAGEASAFLVLADRKIKEGGTLGLVMPLSLLSGDAWEASRQLLRRSYSNLIFVTIAGARHNELSFSADTGMGECLVIGRKHASEEKRAIFVTLKSRPNSSIVGANIAEQIRLAKSRGLRRLEDGPVGGTPIRFGEDIVGFALEAPVPEEAPFYINRIWDLSLAQVAYQLSTNGLVWLPGMLKGSALPVPIVKLSSIGKIGPYPMDINANASDGSIRGPFVIEKLKEGNAPTYPVLWAHEADRERSMEFEAESEGAIRQGKNIEEEERIRGKADRIWGTASHCHANRDFQFNAQSTAMQFTNRKTIGGRAWPSIKLTNTDEEKALVLWSNSSLGLLLYWWHASKQQAGRGSIPITALESLSILDVTKLSPEALSRAIAIFDEMKKLDLKPVNEAMRDPLRIKIDRRFTTEVLGLDPGLAEPDGPLDKLREKLALEPSVAGGKIGTITDE
jgi:hypothetical protein